MDEAGMDLVEEMLYDKGYTLIMVSYDLTKAQKPALQEARDWSQLGILAQDYSFVAVTATTKEESESMAAELGLDYPFHSGDEVMLKTIVRSNPGYMLLQHGTIVGKWGFRDLPALQELIPDWSELIANASAPLDEEAQLLMEAGVYEEFSFNVLEFDRITPALLLRSSVKEREQGVTVAFILSVVVLLLLSNLVSPVKGS
jgi:hypothetical protein